MLQHAMTPTLDSQTEQANFRLLVADIAWFGLAFAATSRFLSVYAIRLDASPMQLGLLTGLPALMWLGSSVLASWWSHRYPNAVQALRWPTLGMRFVFLLPLFAPLFPAHLQVLWLILATTLCAIPQGVSNVIFMDMFRKAVPNPDHMTALLARRSLFFNILLATGALSFGLWLEAGPFPINYMIMFALAFGAGLMSYRACMKIRVPDEHYTKQTAPRIRPWSRPEFRQVAMAAFVIHLAFTSVNAIIPLRLVQELNLNEGYMALYGMVELGAAALISLVAARAARALGSQGLITIGMVGTGLAALIIAVSSNPVVILAGAGLSGASWTLAAMVGLFRFFNERTPTGEGSVQYAAAYNQSIGVALFAGPMLGSALATSGVSLVGVLLFGAVARFGSAIVTEYPAMMGRWRSGRLAARTRAES
jgi:MFS family permease